MGSDDPHGYDNEKRAHHVEVLAFELDVHPVTVYDWHGFMDSGGYERRDRYECRYYGAIHVPGCRPDKNRWL